MKKHKINRSIIYAQMERGREREKEKEGQRGREGEGGGGGELLTDSSSLLLDFVGHDCLLVVLQLNAETEVAQLDAAFAT